jgi:hypothetical protein
MERKITPAFFNQVAQQMLRNKSVFGAVLCVENGDSSISCGRWGRKHEGRG